MNKALLKELLELTPEERIELAEELWDSIERGTCATDSRAKARTRPALRRAPPRSDQASKWEDVKARLVARYK